jgi:hypothetical protein
MVLRCFLLFGSLIALAIFTPNQGLAEESVTKPTEESKETPVEMPTRFTASWARHYYRGWRLNALETQFKYPKQHSIIKLSVGGSNKRSGAVDMVGGDLNADLLSGILSIELPQEYTIEKIEKTQLWQATIDYEYYWSLYDGKAWKFPFDLYASTGIGGLLDIELSTHKYTYTINFDEEQDLDGTISIPGTSTDTNFSFFVPGCLNFDFSIATVKGCGFFNIENPKNSSGYWAFGFGF